MKDQNDHWPPARERMKQSLVAVVKRNFGNNENNHASFIDQILDQIIRPEFLCACDQPVWSVMRQDDTGNRFEIVRGRSRNEAAQIAADFEASGHKQCYWIEPEDAIALNNTSHG